MKTIAIASGKGGTGKTTIALNLAFLLSNIKKEKVNLLDCDVEAPNDHLFLSADFNHDIRVEVDKPHWDAEKCSSCGLCTKYCNFNAIAKIKNKILIFDELCHSCGSCTYFCPTEALVSQKKIIGSIQLATIDNGFKFGTGKLSIGESLAPMVIHNLKSHMDPSSINILDAPPGTTCPVVKTLENVDRCIFVTEPTPFGLNDLKLAIGLAAKMKIPAGIVINRSNEDDSIIEDFAKNCSIEILGKIPFARKYAKTYSEGKILIDKHPELVSLFEVLYENVKSKCRVPKFIADDINVDQHEITFENKSESVPKELVVISGKGGTGKTTLTGGLISLMDHKVFADNDVDASNLHLIFKSQIIAGDKFIGGKKFSISDDHCTNCGKCLPLCKYKAIKTKNGKPYIESISCEGCGLCFNVCPSSAINWKDEVSGDWYISKTDSGMFSHAKLGIGQENSGKLVSLVRNKAREIAEGRNINRIVNDGPPGIGCPVIASITGTDLALIVTEPTLSGRHDLLRAIELVKHFGIPFYVIINKFDLNISITEEISTTVLQKGSKVIGKIPFDKNVLKAVSSGRSIVEHGVGPAYEEINKIWKTLKGEFNEF